MAQVRLEKERKARVYLQRKQAIVERRKRMPKLALSRTNIPAPASSSNSVLQLVFDYLSPAPGPRCTSKELLSHLRRIQRVAAVNREWRAVALPLFYRTVHIVIGHPLETTDTDDSDDDSDDDDDSDSDSGDDKGQECEDDNMDEDGDEGLLNTVGLSRNGVSVSLSTNIDLLCSVDWIDKAREVQIVVQGAGQTAGQLLRRLVLAGVGKYEWTSIERLRIDMRDSYCTTQTNTTSEQGPIAFYGPHTKRIYGCVLIKRLIKERLHGPASLRAVRVKSDCWPELTDDYDTGETALPIAIECMEIDAPNVTYLVPIPIMVSDALIEQKLNPVVDFEWNPFEYLGDLDATERALDSSNSPLIFSSLKSLVLNVSNLDYFMPYVEDNYPVYSEDEDGYESKRDDTVYQSDFTDKFDSRFDPLPDYSEPQFPVLTRLELRDPITSLVLSDQSFDRAKEWDLSKFRFLRSLRIHIRNKKDYYSTTCIGETPLTILSTVHPNLQHLLLAMNLHMDTRLQFETPSFANNLSSLTLEGEYGQHDVEPLLQLFPNLRALSVCAIVCEPIFTVPTLIDTYRQMCIKQTLTPINSSLCILEVYGQQYFSSYYSIDFIPWSRRLMAPVLNHYRGMLVGLVCRLPSLDAFRVGAQSVDGVNECIRAIVGTNVGPEHIDHLKSLSVQAVYE
ncbi:hypothetical protein H4S07_000201 [Coemansia furcata]|uniref:Uncharacterized protein n=1 Tax=Coemansia furcata TaxID=417177 RepID=A0ACC1LRW3_9FUNG|nr:hypothetical protein H4S07_000201 [Coemansia furcata]